MIKRILTAAFALTSTALMAADPVAEVTGEFETIFDGKTLNGWEIPKGQEKYWKVKDGSITGGDLENPVKGNQWIIYPKNYENFEMTFKVRFINGEGGGLKNSGIQVRSKRHGKKSISGYQVDAGPPVEGKNTNKGLGYWGFMWDEHRRNKMIGKPVNPKELRPAVHDWDWNDYKIICQGNKIQSWINGVAALDFTEKNPKIPADGIIALQAHNGGKFYVQFKDIQIKALEPTPDSPKWSDLKKDK
jgi:hypothetical protein